MSGRRRASAWAVLCRARDRRLAGAPAGGFSLVELTVVLAVMGVVLGLTFGLMVGLEQQQVNVRGTVTATRQAQLATQEVVQYLRSAASPAANYPTFFTGTYSESSTSLQVPALIGDAEGTYSPSVAVIEMNYVASCPTTCPAGTGQLQVIFVGATQTRTVDTYYVLAPTGPIFTYYEYVPGTTTGATQAMTTLPVTGTCLPKIVAIGVNVSFFAGPGAIPTRDAAADSSATVNTVIYLHNADLTYGSTTTSTSTTVACPD